MPAEQAEAASPYAGGTTPAPTAAQADYGNVVGNRNRAEIGGAPIGNAVQGYQEVQQAQQQQAEQNQQREQLAIAAGRNNDMMRMMGFNVATGQQVYDAVMGQKETPVQERTYLENLQNRPRYVDSSQVGDTNTQNFRKMFEMQRAVGMPVPSDEVITGNLLEGQRKIAETTPGTKDDQFFLNELSKWNARGIETSSEYHTETKATGVQQKANKYENWGDVALAVEKGGNLKDFTVDKYGFNPNVGGALGYTKPMKYQGWEGDAAIGQQQGRQVGGVLPGGLGLQETAWGMAKSGKAANVDFQPALDYVNYQKDRMGPYGNLYGGVRDTTPNMPPGAGTPPSEGPIGNARLAWGVIAPTQVPAPVQERSFLDQLNYDIGGALGIRAGAAEPIGYISEGKQLGWTGQPKTEPGTYIEPARGDIFGFQIPVVSNVLAFFQPESIKTISQKTLPEDIRTDYTKIPEMQVISKIPLPDKIITTVDPTTGETITTTIKGVQTETTTYGGVMANTTISGGVQTDVVVTPGLSGYDKLNQGVRDFLRLPKPAEGEAAMRIAGLFNPFTIVPTVAAITAETISPERAGDARAMESLVGFRGQYTQFYEQPLLVPISYAAGAVFGTGAKAVEGVYGASRAGAAELIISRGQTARAAEMYSGFVMEKAPLVLAGMYGVSIAARSTEGFTNFQPENVVPKARGIVMQEAVPMGYGFSAPSQIVKTVQISEIGYKSAVQEGMTTGRFEYYVKQPVTRPIEMIKQDYTSFMQENKPILTPEQKIIKDVLDIQIELKMGEVIEQPENAFVWRQKTGEKLIEYQGVDNSEILGGSMGYLRSRARVSLPEEEAIIVAHTHPYQSGESITPELIRGSSMVLSGEISMKSFVKDSLSLPSDVLVNKAVLSTPSSQDIIALRYAGAEYGTTYEMAISPNKVAIYSTQAKATIPTPDLYGASAEPGIQPKGAYRAWGSYVDSIAPEGIDKVSLLRNPQAHIASTYENQFMNYGRELGFKADILTTAELKAQLPKEPGIIDYLFSKTKPIPGEIQRPIISPENEFATGGVYQKSLAKPRPIPQEVNRNYYSYEGIEKVAYSKSPEKLIVSESQRNYYDYAGIEREAYPTNNLVISAKAKWQEWRTPERLLYLSTYGGSNYLSQGLPPDNWGVTIGTRGIGQVTRREEGGTGGRITTKTVGGAEVTGLRPEQSMFKMGLEDKPVISGSEIRPKIGGQRLDYRNEPRGPMKPMDTSQIKQSAIQIEMQESPTRMPLPERVSQPLSFGFNILQVQQSGEEQRSAVEVMPAFMTAQISGLTQSQSVRQTQQSSQVTEAARSRQFDQVMRQMQREDNVIATRSRQGSAITSAFKTDQIIDQASRQESSLIRSTAQRTDQKITSEYVPWEDQWSKFTQPPPPPMPPGLPFLPAGGGGGGGSRRGRRFWEYFPIGLDISTRISMGGARGHTKKKKGRLLPAKRAKKK